MKHHANRDLREVYWQPDPELERLKKLRSAKPGVTLKDVTDATPRPGGSYVQTPDEVLEAHIEEMERELWGTEDLLTQAEEFVGMLTFVAVCCALGIWIASSLL